MSAHSHPASDRTTQGARGEMSATVAVAAGAPKVGRAGIFGWILFEWSQQPFYSLVTTFLFGPYFVNGFISNPTTGQSLWGLSAAILGILVALLSPIAGAYADASGRRKPWVALSSIFLIGGMAALWYAEPGNSGRIALIMAAYVMAGLAAELNGAFVNAIMPKLVTPSQFGRLSGASVAVAYAGGLLALLLVISLVSTNPATGKTLLNFDPIYAFDNASRQSDRIVGPLCAAWFFIFVLPLFFLTPDPVSAVRSKAPLRDGIAALRQTARDIAQYGNLVRFLIARMIYQSGLYGMFAFAGIYSGQVFGWGNYESGIFGIIIIVAAMIGAGIGGIIDDRIGSKTVILIGLVCAMVGALAILSIDPTHVLFVKEVAPKAVGSTIFSSAGEKLFLLAAILVGLVAGPLNASSRSLMARLSPEGKMAQFFGFYALSGKATSWAPPIGITIVTSLTGIPRLSIAVVLPFLLVGLIVLLRVKVSKPAA